MPLYVPSFVYCLVDFIIRSTYITPDMLLAIGPIYHRNGLLGLIDMALWQIDSDILAVQKINEVRRSLEFPYVMRVSDWLLSLLLYDVNS